MPSTVSDHVLSPRQRNILERVERSGFVSVEELARAFSVTPQTVRRDINSLCERDLLQRYHGGAGLPSTVENVAYSMRRVLNQDAKQRIGELVAKHIPDQASLFITLGTTTEEAARALMNHDGLRIITNNINVAAMMCENRSFDVLLCGGQVRPRDAGITGEATIDFVHQFRVDFALIGISSIDPDGTLFDFDHHEMRVLRAVMANARKSWLLADHSKVGRNALVRLGNIVDMDALFTDKEPCELLRQALLDGGTDLHVAD